MILIPLGLRGKLPRIPILTIIVTLITVAFSVRYFPVLNAIQGSSQVKGLTQKKLELLAAFCPTYGLQRSECDQISSMFNPRKQQALTLQKARSIQKNLPVLMEYVGWVNQQLEHPTDQELMQFPAYKAYRDSMQDVSDWMATAHADILSAKSVTLRSLLTAEFIHLGWLHLIGNLLTFVIFAAILEQRMNALLFLGIYFVGGTLGLLCQLWTNPSALLLVGASANISAVIGAFYVLFFRTKMRFLFSVIVWNKLFYWPTFLMVPIIYLCADVTGFLSGAEGVAHGAHLAGFGIGALLGLAVRAIEPLPAACVYPQEEELHAKLQQTNSSADKVKIADNILNLNPDNLLVMEELFLCIFDEFGQTRKVRADHVRFLKVHLHRFAELCSLSHPDKRRLLRICEKVPLQQDFLECFTLIASDLLLEVGAEFLADQKWVSALRIYDLYLQTHLAPAQAQPIVVTIEKIMTQVQGLQSDSAELAAYFEAYRANRGNRTVVFSLMEKYFNAEGGSHGQCA